MIFPGCGIVSERSHSGSAPVSIRSRPFGPVVTGPLEPAASISNPPRNEKDGNRRGKGPPERQQEVRQQSKKDEDHPEDLSLHLTIVPIFVVGKPPPRLTRLYIGGKVRLHSLPGFPVPLVPVLPAPPARGVRSCRCESICERNFLRRANDNSSYRGFMTLTRTVVFSLTFTRSPSFR